jgi:cytochrome c
MTLAMLAAALAAGLLSLAVQKRQSDRAEERAAMAMSGGDPRAGLAAMDRHGCGACHEAPGLAQPSGRVGPLPEQGRHPCLHRR